MTRDRDTFDLFDPPERGRFGENESAEHNGAAINGASDLVDVEMLLHAETFPGDDNKGAVLVSDNGHESRAQWIPKSQAEIERTKRFAPGTKKDGQSVQLEALKLAIPQWLAKDKGLI